MINLIDFAIVFPYNHKNLKALILGEYMKKEHLYGLEFLRYGLGLYIVLYHTLNQYDISYFSHRIVGMGFIATSTFFIISGFILSYVYLNGNGTDVVELKGKKSEFWKKRFANLYPIHIFSLLLFIVIFIVLNHLNIMPRDDKLFFTWVAYDLNNYSNDIGHFMSNGEIILSFIMNFFMLQSWNPYYLTYNSPAWSISTLFFMYLLFPYVAPKISMLKKPFTFFAINNLIYLSLPIIFVLLSLYDKPYTGILNRNPIARLPEFLAGIVLCNIYFQLKKKNFIFKPWMIFSSIVFILLTFFLGDRFLEHPELISSKGSAPYYLLHNGLLMIPESLLILLFTTIKIKNERFIFWLKRFGGASLPMFALHIPIYFIFTRIEYAIFGKLYLSYYWVFVIIVTISCIFFQEYVVSTTRKKILSLII